MKVPKNIRLRKDQIKALEQMVAADPETDISKLVRKAVDLLLQEGSRPRGRQRVLRIRRIHKPPRPGHPTQSQVEPGPQHTGPSPVATKGAKE